LGVFCFSQKANGKRLSGTKHDVERADTERRKKPSQPRREGAECKMAASKEASPTDEQEHKCRIHGNHPWEDAPHRKEELTKAEEGYRERISLDVGLNHTCMTSLWRWVGSDHGLGHMCKG
jgi:hypothetical protein